MATRKKTATKSPRAAAARAGGFVRLLGAVGLIVLGIAAGYCWRSFYPLALPFESPLVADKSSDDMASREMHKAANAALARAEKAERERDVLMSRIKKLESTQARTERELGDIKIKDVLQSEGN